MRTELLNAEMWSVINGEHRDPFAVLGMHRGSGENGNCNNLVIRAYLPNAAEITVINENEGTSYSMEKIHENGFFHVTISDKSDFFKYRFDVTDYCGNRFSTYDPYSFLPVLTDFDLHLFGEGNHHKVYEKMGAKEMEINGIKGTLFAVWAPCAKRVSVVGSFNQ